MARTEWTPPPEPTEESGSGTMGRPAQPAWMPNWYGVNVNTNTLEGVQAASDPTSLTYGHPEPMSTDAIVGNYGMLPLPTQDALDNLAKALGTGNSTGYSLYAKAVATSQAYLQRGIRATPMQIIQAWVNDGTGVPKPPTGGGGGYGGGAAAPQAADPTAIRRAMDQVTTGLIGRTLSDKEFDGYYKSYVSAFNSNPDMDPAQDMIEAARTDDNYQEFQVATKFAGALSDVIRGTA